MSPAIFPSETGTTAVGIAVAFGGGIRLFPRSTHEESAHDITATHPRAHGGLDLTGWSEPPPPNHLIAVRGSLRGHQLAVSAIRRTGVRDVFDSQPEIPPTDDPVFSRPPRLPQHEAWERELLGAGALTSRKILRASDGSWRVIVSAPDPDAVIDKLLAAYGPQVSVLASRWSAGDLRTARADLLAHLDEWRLIALLDGTNSAGEAIVRVSLPALSHDVHAWSKGLPPGMVELFPFVSDDTGPAVFTDLSTPFSHGPSGAA